MSLSSSSCSTWDWSFWSHCERARGQHTLTESGRSRLKQYKTSDLLGAVHDDAVMQNLLQLARPQEQIGQARLVSVRQGRSAEHELVSEQQFTNSNAYLETRVDSGRLEAAERYTHCSAGAYNSVITTRSSAIDCTNAQ